MELRWDGAKGVPRECVEGVKKRGETKEGKEGKGKVRGEGERGKEGRKGKEHQFPSFGGSPLADPQRRYVTCLARKNKRKFAEDLLHPFLRESKNLREQKLNWVAKERDDFAFMRFRELDGRPSLLHSFDLDPSRFFNHGVPSSQNPRSRREGSDRQLQYGSTCTSFVHGRLRRRARDSFGSGGRDESLRAALCWTSGGLQAGKEHVEYTSIV